MVREVFVVGFKQGCTLQSIEADLRVHRQREIYLLDCTHTKHSNVCSIVNTQTEHPHTNMFFKTRYWFQSMQAHFGGMQTHTHWLAPMYSLEYPVTIECTHQRLQCLLCVWRQTVINWEHPSGTSTDWLYQSQPICCHHWNVWRELACQLFVNTGVYDRVCLCLTFITKYLLWICKCLSGFSHLLL